MPLPSPMIDKDTLNWEPEHAAHLRAFMAFHQVNVRDMSGLLSPGDPQGREAVEARWLYPVWNGKARTIQAKRLDELLFALRTLLNNDKLTIQDILGLEKEIAE